MYETDHRLLEQHMQIHGLLGRYLHHIHMNHGRMMTPYSGQGRVLKFLKLVPEISQRELADLLGIRAQSLGETLSKLEKSGCITRTPSETDRRRIMIRITPEGLKALSADTQENGSEEIFSCLSAEEKEQLSVLFDKIISALEKKYSGPEKCPGRESRSFGRHRGCSPDTMGGCGDQHF